MARGCGAALLALLESAESAEFAERSEVLIPARGLLGLDEVIEPGNVDRPAANGQGLCGSDQRVVAAGTVDREANVEFPGRRAELPSGPGSERLGREGEHCGFGRFATVAEVSSLGIRIDLGVECFERSAEAGEVVVVEGGYGICVLGQAGVAMGHGGESADEHVLDAMSAERAEQHNRIERYDPSGPRAHAVGV